MTLKRTLRRQLAEEKARVGQLLEQLAQARADVATERVCKDIAARQVATLTTDLIRVDGANKQLRQALRSDATAILLDRQEQRITRLQHAAGRWMAAYWTEKRAVRRALADVEDARRPYAEQLDKLTTANRVLYDYAAGDLDTARPHPAEAAA